MKQIFTAFLILFAFPAFAEGFTVDAPLGWKMDGSVGKNQGANTVFYPEKGSWKQSPAVIYIRTIDKIGNSLRKTSDEDLKAYKENAPTAVVTDEPGMFTKDHKIVRVKKIKDNTSGNLELIAYVDDETIVPVITLNARNEKEAAKAMKAYKDLISSYSNNESKTEDGEVEVEEEKE